MRNSKGQFENGHTLNIGRRWRVSDSSRMGGKRWNNGFQKGNKYGAGKQYRLGARITEQTKLKMRQSAKRGPESRLCRGGATGLRKQIRECFKYRSWRLSVFERDGFSCVKCGRKDRTIQADHFPIYFAEILIDNNITTVEQAIECVQLWDINNGRTLCRDCHLKTENHGKRYVNSSHNSPDVDGATDAG